MITLDNEIVLKPFYTLKEEEKLKILEWRNNQNIRNWMYNSNIIQKDEHLKFIDTLQNNPTSKYYLVFEKELQIGVIYFTDIDPVDKKSNFGLYANPELKGIGEKLMDIICQIGFQEIFVNTLTAEVFMNNKKAINLYRKCGFKQLTTKTVKDKDLLIMELKNENRKF